MPTVAEIIQQHSRPLAPQPTQIAPRLPSLTGIRAVLFDIYGTLFISGSGDIGSGDANARLTAASGALGAVGLDAVLAESAVAALDAAIQQSHAASRQVGIDYPEVDIRHCWETALAQLPIGDDQRARVDVEQLATEFEVRANPVWPMPGLTDCLAALRAQGMRLGLVSNAQFFTPELFPSLVGDTAERLGFDPSLHYYSYRHGQAKPGEFLYREARERLAQLSIAAEDALYIGNDMLNDVCPAANVGFRTALFAGDARSLRLRESDSRVSGVEPDLIIVHWSELPRCLESHA